MRSSVETRTVSIVVRDHEQAHVRQVERWGGAFIPVYLLASVWAWSRGRHYYLDNWFETDARRATEEDFLRT